MSGVLVMTAFWATAVATTPSAPQPPTENPSRAPSKKSNQEKHQPAIVTAAGPSSSAAGPPPTGLSSSKMPSASGTDASNSKRAVADPIKASAASATDAAGPLVATAVSTEGSTESEGQHDSSSLVAAQVLSSLSYLQFCRMRLTAYNALLKSVLTSVSTSCKVVMSRTPDHDAMMQNDADKTPSALCGVMMLLSACSELRWYVRATKSVLVSSGTCQCVCRAVIQQGVTFSSHQSHCQKKTARARQAICVLLRKALLRVNVSEM